MRTWTGWLAVLVTAGVALAPLTVQAQGFNPPAYRPGDVEPLPERGLLPSWANSALPALALPRYTARGQTLDYDVPVADPVFPVPLYHDRPESGGFFAAAEFIFWRQTNPMDKQVIAVRGIVDTDGSIHQDLGAIPIERPPDHPIFIPVNGQAPALPGGFIGSARPAVTADQVGGPSTYVPGWRMTMGYRFAEGFTFEVSQTHMFNARYIGGATLVPVAHDVGPALEDTFLYSPVYNFPTTYAGEAQKLALGNPFAAYGIWNGASEMDLRFDQRLDVWDVGGRVPIWETECLRCYGLVGVRNVWMWEHFWWRAVSIDFQGASDSTDVAIYNNTVSNELYGPYIGMGEEWYMGHGFAVSLDLKASLYVDFVREIAKYERGDLATEAKRSRRVYTLAPGADAILNIWWYPIEGVEVRIGYDAMTFFNTISSPNPVSFNFSGLDPEWSHQVFRLVDGFHVGIGLIF